MYNPHSSLHIFNAARCCEIQLLPFDFSSLTPFKFRRFFIHIMKFFQLVGKVLFELSYIIAPADTERKLNVHKTFRRRPGRLLNVLFTFSLRPVSTGM